MITMYSKVKSLVMILTISLMIAASSFDNSINAQPIEKSQEIKSDLVSLDSNIIIPDDYLTIQEGVDNSNPGDVIFVRSGIYKENIVIDKGELHLLGENKFNTVIDIENNAGDAVVISAEGVTFQGFTVTNARCKDKIIWNQSGVVIFSSNVTVKDNIISDNRLGLMSYTTAYNLTICDNLFFYDGFFPGSYIHCIDGRYECTDNIPIESLSLNVTDNTVNGRPLYYLQNIHDTVIDTDAGQVILVNCTNITVKDLYLTNIDFSVMLYYCSNCVVENLTIVDTDGELILFFSENNTIQNNTIKNAFHGICFDIGSKNNIARYNKIYDSMQGITIITLCCGNKIYGNKIHNSGWGMKITSYTKNSPSHDNFVYENEFYKNNVGIMLLITFKDPLCYTYNNTITNNTFLKNDVGIELYSSEGNIIKNNIFKRNLISALFINCSQNYWDNNYWNRPRLLPKPIIGFKMVGKIPMPRWLNIDKHPAKEPYEI